MVSHYAHYVLPESETSAAGLRGTLGDLLHAAGRRIWLWSRDQGLGGSAGSTLVCALAWDHHYLVAHAGDSRCYYVNHRAASSLTLDHTEAARLVREGGLAPERGAPEPAQPPADERPRLADRPRRRSRARLRRARRPRRGLRPPRVLRRPLRDGGRGRHPRGAARDAEPSRRPAGGSSPSPSTAARATTSAWPRSRWDASPVGLTCPRTPS